MTRARFHWMSAVAAILITAPTAFGVVVVDDHFDNNNPLTNNESGYFYDNADPGKVSELAGKLSMSHQFVSGSAFGLMVSNDSIRYGDLVNKQVQIEFTIDSADLPGNARVWVGFTGRPDLAQVFTNANDSYVVMLIQGAGIYRLIGNSNTGNATIQDQFLLADDATNWNPNTGLTVTLTFDLNGYSVTFSDGTTAQSGDWVTSEVGKQDLLGLFQTNISGGPNAGADLNNARITPAFGLQAANNGQLPSVVISHFRVSIIPEPATAGLIVLAGLLMLPRRRRA